MKQIKETRIACKIVNLLVEVGIMVIAIDQLESFILDFLAYRRERREFNKQDIVTLDEAVEIPEYQTEIGKGWPHYRGVISPNSNTKSDINNNVRQSPIEKKATSSLSEGSVHINKNDILPTLMPIVSDMLETFGAPESKKALVHLVNQVIAKAITIPTISEIMNTSETMMQWGRAQLLQTVVELSILITINSSAKQH